MLTKKQKSDLLEKSDKNIQGSKALIFLQFKGVSVGDFTKLRRELKKVNADLKIVKKRLLNIALKKAGISFEPGLIKEQLATIFAGGDLVSVAGTVHKFVKALIRSKKGELSVIGAYDFSEKKIFDPKEFNIIASLPSREVLLAQIAMMLTMPVKKIMTAINERSKKVTN